MKHIVYIDSNGEQGTACYVTDMTGDDLIVFLQERHHDAVSISKTLDVTDDTIPEQITAFYS